MDRRRAVGIVKSWLRPYVPWRARPPRLPDGVVVGRHTYAYGERSFPVFTEGARIEVGAFCSISDEARVFGGGEHVITRASSYPLLARLFDPARRNARDSVETGPTVIGNDVFIGVGAIVLGGLTVGDGAVVGAGAVVTKSVPPYAVVAGNPAKILRYRFDEETRGRLLALRWWDLSDEEIEAALPLFYTDVGAFLEEMERRHGTRG